MDYDVSGKVHRLGDNAPATRFARAERHYEFMYNHGMDISASGNKRRRTREDRRRTARA